MARQGGWVQLEQSDICLVLNMAKMAKGGFLCTTIEKTQYLVNKFRTKVRKVRMLVDLFPGYWQVRAAIERHSALVCEHKTNGCLHCQYGIAKNPQTYWRCQGWHSPLPDWHRWLAPELMPLLPGTPPAPPCDNEGTQTFQMDGVPLGYVHIYTLVSKFELFNRDVYGKNSKGSEEFIPELLTDEETTSEYYTICRIVIQLTLNL